MTEKKPPEKATKSSFRIKMWDYMEENKLANKSVHNNIPYFKNAKQAAERLSELDEFKNAKVIKINPDKPQQYIRHLGLKTGKEFLIPAPALRRGLFAHIRPTANEADDQIKKQSKKYSRYKDGERLGIHSDIKVDLVVLGSVCVSRDGYRVGKNEGFADLEFGIIMRMGAITQDTVVVTTVHDCQIVDDLPPEIFKEYDVPVDIIVTPTQTIYVNPRLKKPDGIIWNMLHKKRVKNSKVLQEFKMMDEKDGKDVTLSELCLTETEKGDPKSKHTGRRTHRSFKYYAKEVVNADDEGDNAKEAKPYIWKRRFRERLKSDGDKSPTSNKMEGNIENTNKNTRRRSHRHRVKSKAFFDISVKLSNISPNIEEHEVKNAVLEHGVRPTSFTWQSDQGVCFLHFNKLRYGKNPSNRLEQVDTIIANLQELHIGNAVKDEGNVIIVELEKLISKVDDTNKPKPESLP